MGLILVFIVLILLFGAGGLFLAKWLLIFALLSLLIGAFSCRGRW